MAITPVSGFSADTSSIQFNPVTANNTEQQFDPTRNKENVNNFVNAVQLIEKSERPQDRKVTKFDAKDILKEIEKTGTLEGSNKISVAQLIFEDQQKILDDAKSGQLNYQRAQQQVLDRYSPLRSPSEERRKGPRDQDSTRTLGQLVDEVV